VSLRQWTLPAAWAIAAGTVLWTGRWFDPYLARHIPPPQPYPAEGVSWVLALITLEIALLGVVLRPRSYSRSWGRALSALAIASAFVIFAGLGAMHAPPFFHFYIGWTILVAVALAALSIGSSGASLREVLRRQSRT
jgi:hypothetical protein